MRIDTTDIQAEVYAANQDKNILYIKVSIPSLLMYINSCTVRPSPKYNDLWFQLPSFLVGKKWVKPLEFRGDSQFLDLIKDAAMRAADQYITEKNMTDVFPGAKRTGLDEVTNVL